jgi:hypothetical protein
MYLSYVEEGNYCKFLCEDNDVADSKCKDPCYISSDERDV